MGPFEEHAERLLERGYSCVPIIPGTKKPGFFCAGSWVGLKQWTARFNGRASLDAERLVWGHNGAGIGVLTGPASGGTVAVDIDTDDPGIITALLAVLPPTEIKKAGKRGETRFYQAADICSRSWSIDGARIVELLCAGRQTVLPPTMHPDTGEPYRWLGPESLEDVSPDELRPLPPDIAELISAALEPFGYQAPLEHEHCDGEDTPHRQLNEAALAKLSAWVPALKLYKCRASKGGCYEAVATWRPSSTGRADQARTRNLKISRKGIRDFGADIGYTPLDLVMAAMGCDLDAAFAFLDERLGWTPPEIAIQVADAGAPAIEGPVEAKKPLSDPLEPLTRVPGAVGDIVDWISATARRPNRVLALGAAIVTIGTLIGRRVAGPTRSATHLYVVTIAPATAGKDHPRRCILPLLEAARAGSHVHLGDITSQSGFNRAMLASPLAVVVIDEIAGFLGRITSPKSSFWERRLSGKLREAGPARSVPSVP